MSQVNVQSRPVTAQNPLLVISLDGVVDARLPYHLSGGYTDVISRPYLQTLMVSPEEFLPLLVALVDTPHWSISLEIPPPAKDAVVLRLLHVPVPQRRPQDAQGAQPPDRRSRGRRARWSLGSLRRRRHAVTRDFSSRILSTLGKTLRRGSSPREQQVARLSSPDQGPRLDVASPLRRRRRPVGRPQHGRPHSVRRCLSFVPSAAVSLISQSPYVRFSDPQEMAKQPYNFIRVPILEYKCVVLLYLPECQPRTRI